MVTKEQKTDKKCCLYASDFHLEMILLPYIKNKMDNTKFIIFTQDDMSDSIKLLLERVNISDTDKRKILNLNWTKTNEINSDYLKNAENDKDICIIIKGNKDYVLKINNDLKNRTTNNMNIVDCFCVDDPKINIDDIKEKYNEFLSTIRL